MQQDCTIINLPLSMESYSSIKGKHHKKLRNLKSPPPQIVDVTCKIFKIVHTQYTQFRTAGWLPHTGARASLAGRRSRFLSTSNGFVTFFKNHVSKEFIIPC